jgi:starch-binding outer membrane protein SusE/F
MKYFSKILAAVIGTSMLFAACDKVDDLKVNQAGTAPVLTSSAAVIAPLVVDSNNTAITFSWTNPKYATDSATTKYVVQIDSTGRNFSKAVSKTFTGALKGTFTGKELNAILLGYGFAFNTPYDMDVRVLSSYGNNNELYKSNVLKIKMSAYVTPPKVPTPTTNRLFIRGSATQLGWGTVPDINQELCRLDSVTYGGIFRLNGGSEYLLLPVASDFSVKYSVANNGIAGLSAGGSFGQGLNDNFPGPSATGWYKATYDFQKGLFTVASFPNAQATDLWITGDATAGSWVNNPPAPQKFTRLNNCEYEITIALVPGKFYKFLSVSGQWQPQFGGSSATGGDLGANYGGGNDPDAVPTPAVAGNYKINVNFHKNKYTVTKL